jgi:hypothetical protein
VFAITGGRSRCVQDGKCPLPAEMTRGHVRRLDLPWREITMTECGQQLTDVVSWITRDELVTRVKTDGILLVMLSTCLTCLETVKRYPARWDRNPAQLIAREIGPYGRLDAQLTVELRAIALLVAAHRGEFDQTVAGLGGTVNPATARQARRWAR